MKETKSNEKTIRKALFSQNENTKQQLSGKPGAIASVDIENGDITDAFKQKLRDSIDAVGKWVEDHKYRGYEPFDGLSSFLRPLTRGSLLRERLLQQAVRQSPVNIRPLLGVKPRESTKGRGFMAWGYIKMHAITGDERYEEKARRMLDWLIEHKAAQYEHLSWGNHFDFSSRAGRLPKLEPIIVWSSLIGQAMLDAYERFETEKYLDAAQSICRWILALPRERTDSGTCLSYVAYTQSSIHNSNMLGAAMLARTARISGDKEAADVAREAMAYSCTRQRPDGSWWYGEGENTHWIDNFHTAYNLDSLKCYLENSNDQAFESSLRRGFEYYRDTFFERTGRPKYYHSRTYPVDIQCASQSIDTLAYFADFDATSVALGAKVAEWTIDVMQAKDGHFYYRQYPGGILAKTPMLHWGQATMYKGLSHLLAKL